MRVFTYSEARRNLAKLLKLAQNETVRIRRKDGSVFTLRVEPDTQASPFDVPGVKTGATTADVLSAISESRRG